MLTLFGRKYAKNDKEMVSTLFDASGTANGFYKVTTKGIYFSKVNGDLVAFIRKDGLGPVSVQRQGKGFFYSFALCSVEDGWINKPASYSEEKEGARACAKAAYSNG
jgi:hypothetical protein